METQATIAKTAKETDTHCPCCSAAIQFDPQTGALSCEYCGYKEKIDPESEDVVELDFEEAEATASKDWGASKKTVICKSCGAAMVYDELQNSAICPYCGSNHVIIEENDDMLSPNGVIPFSVTKEKAGENFTKWLKGRFFTPSKAKKNAKADEFTGIYLPYWTFDTDTFSRYNGQYGILHRQITERDKDGKTTTRTVTDWYNCQGVYEESIDDELVAASKTVDNDLLSDIEPFETSICKPYKPEYLAGFVSQKYTLGIKDGWSVAQNSIASKLKRGIERQIEREHSADESRVGSVSTTYNNIKYKYIMLPVWMSAFKFKNKIFRFIVNGQTGAVGGKAPVSPLRVISAVLIGIAVLVLLWYAFGG